MNALSEFIAISRLGISRGSCSWFRLLALARPRLRRHENRSRGLHAVRMLRLSWRSGIWRRRPRFRNDKLLAADQYVIGQILIGRGIMPAFAHKLNDEQIAAVATYVRNSWGNDSARSRRRMSQRRASNSRKATATRPIQIRRVEVIDARRSADCPQDCSRWIDVRGRSRSRLGGCLCRAAGAASIRTAPRWTSDRRPRKAPPLEATGAADNARRRPDMRLSPSNRRPSRPRSPKPRLPPEAPAAPAAREAGADRLHNPTVQRRPAPPTPSCLRRCRDRADNTSA